MQKETRKNFAFMGYLIKQNGFTFVSMLLILSILAMMLPLVGLTLRTIDLPSKNNDLPIQHFFLFLQDEVRNADEIDVRSSRLYMKQQKELGIITIRQHHDVVIRELRSGHEIYLREVQEIHFSEKDIGIHVTVTTTEGDEYEKIIAFYQ